MTYVARAVLAAALAVTAIVLNPPTEARADANAPVCALGYGKFDGLTCNYANYDQCRAGVSGLPATCVDNPYLRAAENRIVQRRDRRR